MLEKIKYPTYSKNKLQTISYDQSKVSLPVLVGSCVKPRLHHWKGQVEMLQVKWERLPGCPINVTHPWTLNLHGDWTLTGSKDLQGIPLAHVCKTSPIPLR